MVTVAEQLEAAPKALLMEYAGRASIGDPVAEVKAHLGVKTASTVIQAAAATAAHAITHRLDNE